MRPAREPTFYWSPGAAAAAPVEDCAYVATLNSGRPGDIWPDALVVIDLRMDSPTYGTVVARLDMPNVGDELQRIGWNACSSALCAPSAQPQPERRHLILPALRSSRLYVVDVKDDPWRPKLAKVVEADELARKSGYSGPNAVHYGYDGIYVSALGTADGGQPGGVLLLDHESYEPVGAWELDRGSQNLAYDVWWNLGHGTLLTSEWGTPQMCADGMRSDLLQGRRYGSRLHVWDLERRRHVDAIDLGPDAQMVLGVMPAHDPATPYGFAAVAVSAADLSAAVWLWEGAAGGRVTARKVIELPAEPRRESDELPPFLDELGAVPPFVVDLRLSVDDRWLYVSSWARGEVKRFDVSDPRHPRETASVELGGVTRWAAHPAAGPLNGGPQMLEVSRDGRRVYATNSFYSSWDEQFYPEGIDGWMVLLHAHDDGSLTLDPDFFVPFDGERPHQIRLAGGDASSDAYCHSSP
jgi:selenium-binding protein 1